MSNHANYKGSFGFSADAQRKQAEKYDQDLENVLREWIEDTTGMKIGAEFAEGLKNGVVLCKLVNKLKPKTIKGINQKAKMPFHCMENITKFLNGCRALGVPEHSMFSTVDLYEAKNMTAVLLTLDNLMRGVAGRTEKVERDGPISHRDQSIKKTTKEVIIDPNVRDGYAEGVKGKKKFSGKAAASSPSSSSSSSSPKATPAPAPAPAPGPEPKTEKAPDLPKPAPKPAPKASPSPKAASAPAPAPKKSSPKADAGEAGGYKGSFGLSAELAKKMDLKYDHDLEKELRAWISEVLEEPIEGDFHDALKSGVTLCRLLNHLKKKTVQGINKKTTMPFKLRENINKFLTGCRKLGVAEHSMFTTADLFEGNNMGAVLVTLDSLRRGVLGRTEPVKKKTMQGHRDPSIHHHENEKQLDSVTTINP